MKLVNKILFYLISIPQKAQTDFHKFNSKIFVQNIYTFQNTRYCAGGQIEKNEMGGVCGAYGGGERCVQGSGGET
jgi:hypothetical protein